VRDTTVKYQRFNMLKHATFPRALSPVVLLDHLARAVLVPIALAVLLTFVLVNVGRSPGIQMTNGLISSTP
jgi:hypothetical protein